MSEFRYNRLIAALLQHLAQTAGQMEIDLTPLVFYAPARRALMEKVYKFRNKPFNASTTCDSALIADLATFFARTFWNRKLKETSMASKTTLDQKLFAVGYQIKNEIPKPPKISGFVIEWQGKEVQEDVDVSGQDLDNWEVTIDRLPGLGPWIWEGSVVTEHEDPENPGDVEYEGTWRRPTVSELERFSNGKLIWE